ncbi:uncharacterized protein MELLADRAFT_64572 [Melampsora larici-populina 98AG31]|uniref:Uncharacterized protein n=1 Tax=Melampsora larici-populina (strain 98AG31 / pathotype 3-4-7) TaxID=747676 RepID=F4RRY3_MELLP|nr:uncharacterized protein MELLADRAFT_64572 [Melampsora larici-populina 98AG31]EGG04871.1 hypothetical protein MELLADRAFT_64572 [Melampsora larici-populina 98AG31]
MYLKQLTTLMLNKPPTSISFENVGIRSLMIGLTVGRHVLSGTQAQQNHAAYRNGREESLGGNHSEYSNNLNRQPTRSPSVSKDFVGWPYAGALVSTPALSIGSTSSSPSMRFTPLTPTMTQPAFYMTVNEIVELLLLLIHYYNLQIMARVCDDVALWGVRAAGNHDEDCIICYDYAHHVSQSALRRQMRLQEANRQMELEKAKRILRLRNQSKRRSQFRVLREALYLLTTYEGPYLQNPGDKKRAALFIRKNNLAPLITADFAIGEEKWEWMDRRVASRIYIM